MKRQLGITCDCITQNSPLDNLDIIKDTGFDCFFTEHDDMKTVSEIREKADKLALDFEFIHAPFSGCNKMWQTGEEYLPLFNSIKSCIDSASANKVRTIILHVSSGWTPPPVNDLGLSRFDELVAYAADKNVNVAFENLRKLGNLACLMDRYESTKNVGFCLDCGHEHCYTETVPFMDLFGKRLLCTHIHDNFGRTKNANSWDDLHYLPFDGEIDYAKLIRKLDEYAYQGSLMLEVFNDRKQEYAEMSAEAFIQTAFQRIKKISLL